MPFPHSQSAPVFDSFVVESPPMKFSKPLELDCCSLSVGVLSRAGIVEVPGRLGALLDLELTSVTESNTKTELAKLGLSELLWISPFSLWQDISLLKGMGAWRPGTQIAYKSAWGKWASWCSEQSFNPFQTIVANIVEFLTKLFQDSLQYIAMNTYRSAI
jgi:hypothetical protein